MDNTLLIQNLYDFEDIFDFKKLTESKRKYGK